MITIIFYVKPGDLLTSIRIFFSHPKPNILKIIKMLARKIINKQIEVKVKHIKILSKRLTKNTHTSGSSKETVTSEEGKSLVRNGYFSLMKFNS